VDRQAQLLRRNRLGSPGRELQDLPLEGRPVAIDGRLEWREWEDQQGNKRQSVEIIADTVQFLGSRGDGPGQQNGSTFAPQSDVPADTSDFDSPVPAGAGAEDDIPF
jgi:single-strand DNA-binding protein